MARRMAVLFILLLLMSVVSGCDTVPMLPSQPEQGETQTPTETRTLPSVDGEIWYSTQDVERPPHLRSGPKGDIVATGERFKPSHDGQQVAILTGRDLAVIQVGTGVTTPISSNVWDFGWVTGTDDLYYLVRDTEIPSEAEWHLRVADGTEKTRVRDQFLGLLAGKLSPGGDWLVYPRGPQWIVASLQDSTRAVVDSAGETPGTFAWADADHISVIFDDAKIIRIKVPGGERETFAGSPSILLTHHHWTPDGSAVAVGSAKGTIIFRKEKDPIVCREDSRPLGWSPDGRYLVLQSGNSPSTFHLSVLDIRANPDTCAKWPIPGMQSLVAWHPDSSAVILQTLRVGGSGARLEAWAMTGDGPILIREIGEGSDAGWMVP